MSITSNSFNLTKLVEHEYQYQTRLLEKYSGMRINKVNQFYLQKIISSELIIWAISSVIAKNQKKFW